MEGSDGVKRGRRKPSMHLECCASIVPLRAIVAALLLRFHFPLQLIAGYKGTTAFEWGYRSSRPARSSFKPCNHGEGGESAPMRRNRGGLYFPFLQPRSNSLGLALQLDAHRVLTEICLQYRTYATLIFWVCDIAVESEIGGCGGREAWRYASEGEAHRNWLEHDRCLFSKRMVQGRAALHSRYLLCPI